MDRAASRLLAARLVGVLAVLEAACLLGMLIFVDIGWGIGFFGLLGFVYLGYFLVLLLLGIGAIQTKYWSRLGLSTVLIFQTCWLVVAFPLDATEGHHQGCDFSCYAGPLEQIAIPAVLCLAAAWVVYPGLRPKPQGA
jgi:hypothetical protein